MNDFPDFPDFLRLTAPRPYTPPRIIVDHTPQRIEDSGPGSIARRLGYPEHPGDAEARAEIEAARSHRAAIREALAAPAKLAFFAEQEAKRAAERELAAKVQQANEERHRAARKLSKRRKK